MTPFSEGKQPDSRSRTAVAGVISDIKPQRRHPERVSIFVDGDFAFGLPAEEVSRRGLRRGYELSMAESLELVSVDEVSRCTEAALQLISYRPRAERELRSRLRRKGFSDLAIEKTVERMLHWGYLNDESFAEQWVNSRLRGKPRGARLLRQELLAKGVDREVAQEAIDAAEIDEYSAAMSLARKRYERLSGLEPEVRERRLSAYLARRGYDWGLIRRILRELEEK